MAKKVVTISYSCKAETYEKIMDYKAMLEADRIEKVPLSQVIEKLIKLGFTYREVLKTQELEKNKMKQTKLNEEKKDEVLKNGTK